MNANEELIRTFYQAFQNKDYKTMQACYAENARFSDPVFHDLDCAQVKAMWEMLLSRSKDLQLEFGELSADAGKGRARWTATYTFSKTGRKVVNRVEAAFIFENGKILQHTDIFSFHKWASQAMGITGFLLGRTGFLKRKVQKSAMDSLRKFMTSRAIL